MTAKKKDPSTKKAKNIESSAETRSLACKLTDKELLDKSQQQAALQQQLRQAEAEKKSTVSTFGARIKSLQGQIDESADCIANRSEQRKVPVRVDRDFGKGEVREYRMDGPKDELIHERKMTSDERQTTIPDADKNEETDDAK